VESVYFEVDYLKAANLEAALRLLAETDHRYQYSVAWIDCIATGRSLGRSVLMLGNSAPRSAIPAGWNPLAPGHKGRLGIPFDLPAAVLNPISITETALDGLTAVLEKLSRNRVSSFLAVLKSAGEQGQGMLSFLRRASPWPWTFPCADRTCSA